MKNRAEACQQVRVWLGLSYKRTGKVEEETEAQKRTSGHPGNKWQSQDSNLGVLTLN